MELSENDDDNPQLTQTTTSKKYDSIDICFSFKSYFSISIASWAYLSFFYQMWLYSTYSWFRYYQAQIILNFSKFLV